jgi:hypothetical protein
VPPPSLSNAWNAYAKALSSSSVILCSHSASLGVGASPVSSSKAAMVGDDGSTSGEVGRSSEGDVTPSPFSLSNDSRL